jgi:hypothetical protein
MSLKLWPLYGLSCNGEPLPGASDLECGTALAAAAALKDAMERAPSPELANPPSGPEETPDYEPQPGPAMGFRR